MKTEKFFLDTNIPMYAAGKEHKFKEQCMKILEKIANGNIFAFTDTEVFQEIIHRFISQKKIELGFQIFDNLIRLMEGKILPITQKELKKYRTLAEKYPEVKSRDLIHLSVMITNSIEYIISIDKHFEKFKEVKIIHPADLL